MRHEPAADQQKRASAQRLFTVAKVRVNQRLGNAVQLLGPDIYRALLAQELLHLAATQDEDVTDESVRHLVTGFLALLNEFDH